METDGKESNMDQNRQEKSDNTSSISMMIYNIEISRTCH